MLDHFETVWKWTENRCQEDTLSNGSTRTFPVSTFLARTMGLIADRFFIGAEFDSPDNPHSKAVEGGNIVSWSKWLSGNRASFFKLENFLKNWALDQDTAGRMVCGYSSISLEAIPSRSP
jgi:hypothetical protein